MAASQHPSLDAQKLAALPRPYRHVSVVDGVEATLREWIVDGHLLPGAQLKEVELSEALNISRHTLRAAIQVLTQKGLLRRERNHGAFVVALSAVEVEDLLLMRLAIESQAAAIAVERKLDLAPLKQVVEAFGQLTPEMPPSRANDLEVRFHRGLLEIVGSPRFLQAFDALEAPLRMILAEPRRAYWDDEQAHRMLFAALTSNDVETARAGVRTHLEWARAEALEAIGKRG